MKVEQSFVIDNVVVEKVCSFGGIDVYLYGNDEGDEVVHYFVKGNEVLATQRTEASYGQGCGYISESVFDVIKAN